MNNIQGYAKNQKYMANKNILAFTLIELIISITVIGILASISIISYGGWKKSVTIASMKSDLLHVASAMESSLNFNNKYPATVPSSFTASEGVVLTGDSTDGGKTYCVAASSTSDPTIKYYISSDNGTRTVSEGDCSAIPNISGTLVIGVALNASNVSATITPATCNKGTTQYGIRSRINSGDWTSYSVWSTTLTSSQIANDGVKYVYQARARCYLDESTVSAVKTSAEVSYIDPIPTPIRPNAVATNSGGSTAYTWDTPVCTAGTAIRYQYKYTITPAGYDSGWVGTNANIFNATTVTKGQTYSIITQSQCYNANTTSSWSASSTTRSYYCPYDTFAKVYGRNYSDMGSSVVELGDGSYVTTGHVTPGTLGTGTDLQLTKFNPNGVVLWSRIWTGSGSFTDEGRGVVLTADGGFAVTGQTFSFGTAGDMVLVKYASDGTLLWSRTWGGANADEGNSIIQTSDGGLVITGSTSSYGGGNIDAFLVKYDSNGNFLWNTTYGGSNYDNGYSVIQTSDGGIAITGRTGASATLYDIFLAKFNASGVLSWGRTWGGASYDEAESLIQTNDGGLVIAGQTNSYSSGGWPDVMLIKYSSSGTFMWNKMIGGLSTDTGKDVIETEDGSLVLLSMVASYGAGNYDALLSKFTSDGTIVWNTTWGSATQENLKSLIRTSSGGFLAVGFTSSYGAGGSDITILRYNNLGGFDKCISPTMCQSYTIVASAPVATMGSSTMPVSNPTATKASPAVTLIDTPAITTTTVIYN